MTDAGADADLLEALCQVSAEAASMVSDTAYSQIVQDRLASLDCRDVAGFQSLAEFTDRRRLPAVRTCASFMARLDALSVRIERATSLLRTRVDLARQAQNVELLRSVDANAARQLRLQHLVEGLSVIAVSYYALGLLGRIFPLLARWTGTSERLVEAVALLPVMLLVGLYLRWETHRVTRE